MQKVTALNKLSVGRRGGFEDVEERPWLPHALRRAGYFLAGRNLPLCWKGFQKQRADCIIQFSVVVCTMYSLDLNDGSEIMDVNALQKVSLVLYFSVVQIFYRYLR